MTFQPLSPLVREARANTPLPPLSREAAAAVALETWGERALALPALVNVAAGIPADTSPLIDDVDAHREWAREAARWILMLGLLLDAQGSPVLEGEDVPVAIRRRAPARPGEGPVVRRVYLDEPTARAGSSSGGTGGVAEGRLGLEVPVRGHLKRQPYGPAQSLRRWVYVESYEARRWIAPRPLRLVVHERPGAR